MTSKHDSWVWLKDSSHLDPLIPLFPKGFPVRDPFPTKISYEEDSLLPLWKLDPSRMGFSQQGALSQYLAKLLRASLNLQPSQQEILDKWLYISEEQIGLLEVGKEGLARSIELYLFLFRSGRAVLEEFYDDQFVRWIQGNESPNKVVENLGYDELPIIDDIDFKVVFPELGKDSRSILPIPPLGEMMQGQWPSTKVVIEPSDFLGEPLTANLN